MNLNYIPYILLCVYLKAIYDLLKDDTYAKITQQLQYASFSFYSYKILIGSYNFEFRIDFSIKLSFLSPIKCFRFNILSYTAYISFMFMTFFGNLLSG